MPDSKQIAPSPSRAALVAAERVFKTAHFADQSIKAGIHAAELCHKAKKLSAEQGENLGGNVRKTRLNRNAHRAILLRKVGQWWIYVFLFAKKDRENITSAELRAAKKLATDYARGTPETIDHLVERGYLLEICK